MEAHYAEQAIHLDVMRGRAFFALQAPMSMRMIQCSWYWRAETEVKYLRERKKLSIWVIAWAAQQEN